MGQEKAKRSCLIMMTTYNGELFLEKQLQSIVDQTYTNWELIAQDDGSADATEAVFSFFANKDKRFQFCKNESGNHGPYQNFNV